MSARKPGAGVRVSGGRLRVDAARAIDKLRTYQLADPTGWVLEVVRAGVGLSARAIAIEGSASDVFVAIACEPPPDDRLLRVFEELVDPSPDEAARPLRLLGIGLNAALGGSTRFTDVYTLDAHGVRRVRFTPEVFVTEGDDQHDLSRGLRSLAVEAAALPSFAPRPERGLVLHVRSKASLTALSRWATGELPRELSLVNEAATEVAVPISVNGLPVPRDPSILLREPLADGGYVALVTPRAENVRATLEASELGVVLSREPWTLPGLDADAAVPLVLRIDRRRLPTNAARSAARWDEPILEHALDEGRDAIARLVERLCARLTEEREPGKRSWLRLAGLMLLAAQVRGASFREKLARGEVEKPFAPLLDAELLLDATGRARSVRSLLGTAPPEVHYGATFAKPALAPWVGNVLAAPPGDPTHLLFGDLPPPTADDALRIAEHALLQRERWLALPVRPPVVEPNGGLVRVALASVEPIDGTSKRKKRKRSDAASDGLPGLVGEVVLGAGETRREIELRLEGRTLEQIHGPSAVAIRAVAEHAELAPTPAFDAAQATPLRASVISVIDRAVVLGSEAIARVLAGAPPDDERVEWLVDPATVVADPRAAAVVREGVVARVIASGASPNAGFFAASPLALAAAWPASDGSMLTLAQLRGMRVVGIVSADARGIALPVGRTHVIATAAERLALVQALGGVSVVDYGAARGPRPTAQSLAARQLATAPIGITFDLGDCRGVACWGGERSELVFSHVGASLGTRDGLDAAVPTRVVVDDDRLVPSDGWKGVAWSARATGDDVYAPARLSTEIARQVVEAWRGARPDTLVGEGELTSSGIVRAVLREAGRLRFSEDALAPIRALPLFPVFRRKKCASVDELASLGALPYVSSRAITPDLSGVTDTFALDLQRVEVEGIAKLFGLRARISDATETVRARLEAQVLEQRLARLRRGSPVDVTVPGAHPTAPMSGTGILEGLIGYAPHVRDGRVRVLFEGRPFAVLEKDAGIPPYVEGVVSIDASLLDPRIDAVSEAGRSRIRGAAVSASRKLLPKVVSARGASLFVDPTIVGLATALVDGKKRRGEPGEMLDVLLSVPSLTSVQGETLSIAAAIGDTRELAFVSEALEWHGPLPTDTPDLLDRPIPIVPWGEEQPARRLLARLAGVTLLDVTVPLRRLMNARRAARGLGARPKLPTGHVTRLARTVEELAERSMHRELLLETFGLGAIVLSHRYPAQIAFHASGALRTTVTLELVPSFEAAVESPLVGPGTSELTSEARARVQEAAPMLLAELLRALADARAFEGAPDWAIDAQRDAALLGGAPHLTQLQDVPLFTTTTGERATFATLRAQAARKDGVWWTSDLASVLTPLDAERLALRLSRANATLLGKQLKLVEADEELRLDAIARTNRDRAPSGDVAVTSDERASPFGAVTLREDGRELTIVPLLPSASELSGMTLFRGGRLLERREIPCELPAIVRVEAPDLTPNRTWEGAVRNDVLERIEATVQAAIEGAVREALPKMQGASPGLVVDAELLQSISLGRGRVMRGSLWLGSLDPSECTVRVIDTDSASLEDGALGPLFATAMFGARVAIPVEGTLVLWGALGEHVENGLDAVGRHVYPRLLSRVASRLEAGRSPDADLDLAHLVRGSALGFVTKGSHRDALDLPISFGVAETNTLGEIVGLFRVTSMVVAIEPQQVAHANEVRATLASPIFVLDGSLASEELRRSLGDRVRTLHAALEERMGLADEMPEVIEVAPAPLPVEKKPKKNEARPSSVPPPVPMRARAGPIEPLALTLAKVLEARGSLMRTVVDPERRAPMVSFGVGELSLAGGDPRLRAIAGTSAGRDRASKLVAAHALGLGADPVAALRALEALLE